MEDLGAWLPFWILGAPVVLAVIELFMRPKPSTSTAYDRPGPASRRETAGARA